MRGGSKPDEVSKVASSKTRLIPFGTDAMKPVGPHVVAKAGLDALWATRWRAWNCLVRLFRFPYTKPRYLRRHRHPIRPG